MIYLSSEDILVIHDETIEKEGGILGVRDMGLLYSVAERPKMAIMGREFYADVFSKAAAILEGLATFHVFTDGNKRTAFVSCATFLGLNGYELAASNEKIYSFLMAVAVKKKTIAEIAVWLKKNSKRLDN